VVRRNDGRDLGDDPAERTGAGDAWRRTIGDDVRGRRRHAVAAGELDEMGNFGLDAAEPGVGHPLADRVHPLSERSAVEQARRIEKRPDCFVRVLDDQAPAFELEV